MVEPLPGAMHRAPARRPLFAELQGDFRDGLIDRHLTVASNHRLPHRHVVPEGGIALPARPPLPRRD